MLNTQPTEPIVTFDFLDVVDVWKTLQGEGPFAGQRAVFVRLAGCNLQCPLCDTDYTSKRVKATEAGVLGRVRELLEPPGLIVLTGGEPFRQDIGPFISLARRFGFRVQVETNGTVGPPSPFFPWQDVTIVCSPKTPRINKLIGGHTAAIKYVMGAENVGHDGLPTSVLGMRLPPARPEKNWQGEIYLQPLDEQNAEKNAANTKAVVDSCLRFGYRLCLQTHKLVGLD